MAIVFECIDVACQQADNSFFVPVVNMFTQSTSTFATVRGYSEFGIPSSPPKKYMTITFSGKSERVAFTAEQTARQCAGAEYVYSGVGQIDVFGNQVSNYSKKFFAQCSKQFWPPEPIQTNNFAITTQPGQPFPKFVGFCFPSVLASCPTCDPNEANWSFIGDQAVNVPIIDLEAFMHGVNDPVITKTSWTLNDTFQALTSITTMPFSAILFGTDVNNYSITAGANTLTGRALITNPPSVDYPPVAIKDSGGTFIFAQYVVFTDTNNYSAVLTDEYTDALAMANASTVQGTGKVAQNLPRTTGFTSVFTTVVFTLLCKNLLANRNYVVAVDFWDSATNITTTKQYPFTASAATNTIIDSIPTPAAGHSTQVKNPRIAFA